MRVLFAVMLALGSMSPVLADTLANINGQLSIAQARNAQLNAQLGALQRDYRAIVAQHDALQQMSKSDAAIGQQVAELETRAAQMQAKGAQVANNISASDARVQSLLQRQTEYMQSKNTAGSRVRPQAIEPHATDSSCQLDTSKCGKTAAVPEVTAPLGNEAISAEVATDPEYERLAAQRTAAQRNAARAQGELDKLTAQQQAESDPKKRQRLQISMYDLIHELAAAKSTVRTADIGIEKVKIRIEGPPDMGGAPADSKEPAK